MKGSKPVGKVEIAYGCSAAVGQTNEFLSLGSATVLLCFYPAAPFSRCPIQSLSDTIGTSKHWDNKIPI